MAYALEIKEVSLEISGRILLDRVNLAVPAGSITALMGPSGVGKTTLLRVLVGMQPPTSGQVLINGQDIYALSKRDLNTVRQGIGYLFQQSALFSGMSVYENVAFPLREHTNLSERVIRDLVMLYLEAVGLRGARDLSVEQLSGGMARRVALARSIALNPSLLFFDEPLAGQDPINVGIILRLIRQLTDNLGITSLIVSHDVTHVLEVATSVHILSEGTFLVSGEPKDVFASELPVVRQFIEGLSDGPIPFQYPAIPIEEDFLYA